MNFLRVRLGAMLFGLGLWVFALGWPCPVPRFWYGACAAAPAPTDPQREVVPGYATRRLIPGEPFDLAGRRIVFTNWHFVDPGDLDWINDKGESVYVKGNEGPLSAHYVGKNTPRGIRLVVRKPQLIGPMERPHRQIMQDGGRYRGWTSTEVFESADAVKWEKKAALVFNGPFDEGVYQIFKDPSAAPEERYKAVYTAEFDDKTFDAFQKVRPDDWEPRSLLHFGEDRKASGLRGAVSPDGVTWRALPEPLVMEYADTLNTAYFDPLLHRYVLYTRYWSVGPYTSKLPANIRNSWTGVGRRAIGRSETTDFHRFPPSELILEPNNEMGPADQLYTNCHTTIPGAPDHHLFFPTVWHVDRDNTSIWMATSHDGKVWNWAPGGPLLDTGPFGRWDGGCIWALPDLIELPNGDWALPLSGHNVPHKYPRGQRQGGLGYAVWPKGRLMGVEAPDRGSFSLIRVMPPGRTLKINAVTQRVGGVRVQVDGVNGRDFAACDPLIGDLHWASVTWKGQSDLGNPEGKAVRLRFDLDGAILYGLQFD